MIKSFRNTALKTLWETGVTAKIDVKMHRRILARLTSLDAAARPEDMNLVGYDFHALRGFDPTRYTVHINGPWCVTFEFSDGDTYHVDLEQYH
jgi:proteic killer suppression protein